MGSTDVWIIEQLINKFTQQFKTEWFVCNEGCDLSTGMYHFKKSLKVTVWQECKFISSCTRWNTSVIKIGAALGSKAFVSQ